ncbi:RagB/SusD family nutrient uptake outer membrane protein [Odoribacter splanchnicus]|uniref:RagB/SusD family nutrient uptake outer membrane protein n=1 Tax=Odoribacter splanchnicus TaxID=28118 RepID=UPI000DD7F81D|nr:RagB/SusD family nutrient uptake outer membrane protein [Odoribacter splanchnicus]
MKKYLLFFVFLSVHLCACEDFLDQKSQMQVDAEHMFQTEQGFKDALTQCYVGLAGDYLYGKYMSYGPIETMAQHWELQSNNWGNLYQLDFTLDNARQIFELIYGEMYNVIVHANDVLRFLEKNGAVIESGQTRDVIEGEARAIRAFVHFDVLRLFGQMPFEPGKTVRLGYAETVGKQEIPFLDFDSYVEKLLKDLDMAEALLAESDPLLVKSLATLDETGENEDFFLDYRRFRFNLYAVKALKARVNLYLGRTEEAYRNALSVIQAKTKGGENVISLSGSDDLEKEFYAMPSESIMLLSKTDISNTMFSTNSYYISSSRKTMLFEGALTGDIRIRTVWGSESSGLGGAVPLFRKFLQPSSGTGTSSKDLRLKYQVIPLLRLAEMYLIAMETAPSESEANRLYKDFMLSRQMLVSQDLSLEELRQEIEKQYRRELFGEGQMFFYYKRHSASSMLWGRNSDLTEDNYIVPLPETELE